jgi:1,4-alpha-glucan branching enzyme
MIRKLASPKTGHVRVAFELPACIWADRIFLVGDFNDWDPRSLPFHQGRDGIWRVYVDLLAGRSYEFRYLVDGRWQTDYHADGWATNTFGSQNSVVHALLPPDETVASPHGSLVREESPVVPFPRESLSAGSSR